MKILFVTTIPRTLNAFFGPIAKELRTLGHEIHGLANSDGVIDSKKIFFDQTFSIQWTRGPLSGSNFFLAPSQLKKILMAGDYDIVHVSTPIAGFITRTVFASLKGKISTKLVYTAYGLHFFKEFGFIRNFIFSSLEKRVNSIPDYMILSNKEDQNTIRALGLMDEQKILYFPSAIGVDFTRFSIDQFDDHDERTVRQQLDLPENSVLFLSVAEFIPRKRPHDLLLAFSKVANQNVYLAFAGDGRWLDKMRRLATSLGIIDRVRFLGFRKDVPLLMKAADCLILVSEREGIPMNLIEGLRMGTPFIGSNIRGTRQLIEYGCGVGVTLRDIDEITKAIEDVASRPSKLIEMSNQGLIKTEEFSFENIFALHKNLYDTLT